jgi:hypothetical protein
MPKTVQTCPSCDLPHVTKWAGASCLPCWKKDREYDLSKADLAFIEMQEAYVTASQGAKSGPSRASENHLKVQVKLLQQKVADRERTIATLRSEAAVLRRSSSGAQTFDQVLIRTLLTLCHPDKHYNSETATEATKKLLAMRKKK